MKCQQHWVKSEKAEPESGEGRVQETLSALPGQPIEPMPEPRYSECHPDLSRIRVLEQFKSKVQEPTSYEGKNRIGIS